MPLGEESAKECSEEAAHACLRNVPLGQDRDGRLVWKLETAAHLTGCGLSFMLLNPHDVSCMLACSSNGKTILAALME